jgi:hypothetical protein
MIARAETSGCPTLVETVDLIGGSNRLTAPRAWRYDTAAPPSYEIGRPVPREDDVSAGA